MEEHAFFLEIQRLSEEMDDVIKKHGMQDRIMSVSVIGLIDEDLMGNSRLQAIYSYSLDSKEELNSIIEFINSSWEQTDVEEGYKDIDDLLDGTGVGLE
tara:strand:+ start:146 stop:442 length:297 start_codon:yes stop_codon:yes gene_type:complete